ncbi:transglycosylase domain-containing protein [Mogibacterium pumilum]|uniref:Penicillin-binding protein 1A n=1 Tax=Mogibacterium pumilum TaxID=86332 RepID=A0A223ASG3_9FIRM|nr:transglycosylase domain-containing protein [Mogibacterium pumilum]ASS37910.1 hypothetical protein AXF17_05335 [Mogibacterium pumilum]
MENNSTNIKELIKRLKNGERLSPEEMRTVANHIAQLKFEKEQKAKRARAVANEGEKKGLSFHEQVAKAEADAKKNRLRNNLEKNSSKHNSNEAALNNKNQIISEDGKDTFYKQVAKAEAEAAKRDKSIRKRAKEEKKLLKQEQKAKTRGEDRGFSPKRDLRHPVQFIKRVFTKPNPYYTPGAGEYIMVAGKKVKNKARTFSIKYAIRNFIVMGVVMTLMFSIYASTVIAFAPKIDPHKIYDQISTDTIIYDDTGKRVGSVNSGESRTIIKYKDIPKHTVDAFVALEDKTFWKHHGFNWTRMVGAIVSSFGRGNIRGTSTLTQQLARNVYLPNIKSQRSVRRKILEMYYAAKIERTLSKKEIFAAYVNSIYFGYGNYGIENASKTYFSKSVNELSVKESAALAAMPQSPDTYSLIQNADSPLASRETSTPIKVNGKTYIANDIAKSRRQIALKLMYEQGYITKSQYKDNASVDLVDFINPTLNSGSDAGTSYFKDYTVNQVIRALMKKYKLNYKSAHDMVYNGGLKIYSTMDSKAQKAVEDGFKEGSYFPSLTGLKKDSSGNIVSDKGSITLYAYDNMIQNDRFILQDGECKKNSDGSITIYKNKRLNIYKTSTANGTDYSLELKPSYVIENGNLYIIPGGYINIPSDSKSMDKSGNLVISAKFIKNNSKLVTNVDGNPAFTDKLYILQDKVIQPQGAMVITEVGTGKVKAMVGGRGVTGKQLYNRAINPRQPGSSIKPLAVYSAALQRSYEYAEQGQKYPLIDPGNDKQGTDNYGDYLTAASIIIDEPIKINGRVWPKNSNNRYSGPMTMRKGMQSSTNVVAVKLYEQLGADYSASMVEKYGISTLNKSANGDMNPAALALGGLSKGVSPYEMAEAYATFPNGGVRVENRVFTKVVDRDGRTILTTEKKKHKVLDEGVAYIMVTMLKSVVNGGTGSNAAISGVEVGGKTGTTDSKYDIWFDGITPKYAASLWIGTDVNIPLTSSSSSAAALWSRIMRNMPNIRKGSYKPAPSNVIRKNGEYFTKGTEGRLGSNPDYESKETEVIEDEQETTDQTHNNSSNSSNQGNQGNNQGSNQGNQGNNQGNQGNNQGNNQGQPNNP